MLQFNTLIVHVIRIKDLPIKSGRQLDAYASLNITGTDKWRSKIATNPQRLDPSGGCFWDEHLEFQLNECYTDFQININHKSKLGASETLASMVLKLANMPHIQNARWFQLHKKGHPEKLRGMILMSFEFKNVLGGMSISQMSLNAIGKENKLDKLKRRINFGRKKAKMDAQSMISVSLSRRSSICSNSSALAFSPVPSPIPNSQVQQDNLSLISSPPDPSPNLLSLRSSNRYREKRLSAIEDTISRSSNISPTQEKMKTPKKLAAKFRQKADQFLNMGSNRKSVEEFNDSSPNSQYNHADNSRPQSIGSSSGFGSLISSVNQNDSTSREHLIGLIDHLRNELQQKERRILDLEDYTGRLLSKIIDKYPDILQVN